MLKKLKSAYCRKKILFALLISSIIPATAFAAGVTLTYPGSPGPLFNETNMAPGQEIIKAVTIDNGSTEVTQISFRMMGSLVAKDLRDKVTLSVKNGTDTVVTEKTLTDIYGSGQIVLGNIQPGDSAEYDFIAKLDEELGNEYMGKSEQFDMTMTFVGQTPPPANPVARILNTAAQTLGFNPNQAAVIAPTPEVAGATTNDNAVKGTADTSSKTQSTCPWWLVVAIVLAVALALYGFVLRYADQSKKIVYSILYFLPVVFAIIALGAHFYLQNSGDYKPTIFCDYFWLIVLVETLLAYTFYYYFINKTKKPVSS